jgi:hypothetical protein
MGKAMKKQRAPFDNGNRRALDPRRCNIGHDANVLDHNGSDRDRLVERFRILSQPGGPLTVVMAGGVRGEIQNPRTPDHVKAAALPQIFNLRPALIASQQDARHQGYAIMQGNAKPGVHAADASHVSEAVETGCSYFITEDHRILDKRGELRVALPPSLTVVTLAEFFTILDDYETGRRP